MKAKLKRIAIHIVGWGFIILGVLGLFLPILQGILFILIGLLFLSSVSPWAARALHWLRRRFPSISSKLDEAAPKAKHLHRRMSERLAAVGSKAAEVGKRIWKPKRTLTKRPANKN